MENYYRLNNILSNLASSLRKQDFLVYFKKMSILDINDDKIRFWVVSSFMKDNLNKKFYKDILEASQKEVASITTIELEVDKNIDNPSNWDVIECMSFLKWFLSKKKKEDKVEDTKDQISSWSNLKSKKYLNNRYTLENFIVWSDNQLAFSACEAVSKDPGKSYNPLYIYGDVWLGKTHLLQASGNSIIKKFKDKKVLYTTADKFISDYVSAVKKRSVERFRAKFKDIDVLMIDDVQFLAKKEQTQNELYNVFNILYDSDKQIILSWDRPPNELSELEPRLKSRFQWGITVDIWKPDFETRLAILQEKSRQKEFLINNDVAEFIAINVVDSVRELEGVLNQIIAEYELDGSFPSLDKVAKKLKKLSFTSDILGNSKNINKTTIKSYEDIIDAVSNHFGIEKEWILWENRKKEFMIPRQVSMYLLKTKMHYTYERIWNIFSGRNHASVLYSCNKLDKLIKKDKKLLYELNVLRENIWI